MFFRKKTRQAGEVAPEWSLPVLLGLLREAAPLLETRDIEPLLMEARLADHCRDMEADPPGSATFRKHTGDFDAECWRRFALSLALLDHADSRNAYASSGSDLSPRLLRGLAKTATSHGLLTLALLRQSDVRMEEFARRTAEALGVAWQGETVAQSKARLQQIDYPRLLAEAEAAKAKAQERMEYLRKKQAEDEARSRRRGKQ